MLQGLNLSLYFFIVLLFYTNSVNALRIVSLAPNLTEVVYYLGAGDSLVGVTNQCDFPIQARNIKKIGDYNNPNLEIIMSLRPDIVLAAEGNPRYILSYLKNQSSFRGKIFYYEPHSILDVGKNIQEIGNILGKKNQANNIAKSINNQWEILKIIKNPQEKYILFLDLNPIYAVSSKTWIGSLFQQAGFENIVENQNVSYPQLSEEFLLTHKPDVVFVAMSNEKKSIKNKIYKIFKENKNNAFPIIFLPESIFVRPGPRVIDAMKLLTQYKLFVSKKGNR